MTLTLRRDARESRRRRVFAAIGALWLSAALAHPAQAEQEDALFQPPGAVALTSTYPASATAINSANVILLNMGSGIARAFAALGDKLVAISPQSTLAFVEDVNEQGTVAGAASMGRTMQPLIWTAAGGVELLPLPEGSSGARGVAIDEAGNVVVTTQGFPRQALPDAFVYRSAMRSYVPLPGVVGFATVPSGVNARGDIVGTLGHYDSELKRSTDRPVLWEAGTYTMRELSVALDGVGGGTSGRAAAINDAGTIVGTLVIDGKERAVMWVGERHELRDLGPGRATAINNRDLVGGVGQLEGRPRAKLWDLRRGRAVYLGGLASGQATIQSSVADVNDDGRAIGEVSDGRGIYAVVFARYAPED
jgi:hypothetical protein